MHLLARLDPGDSVTGLLLVVALQTSVVTLLAALLGRAVLRRRADARHVLWLGALILILISPAVAVVASRLGVGLWVITFPTTGFGATPAADDRGLRPMRPRSDATAFTVELPAKSGGAEAVPRDEVIGVMPYEQANFEAARTVRPELDRGGSPLTGGLALLWAVVALASLGRTVMGWQQLAVLARSARTLDPIRHGATLDRVRTVFGIAALPSVVTSTKVCGPVAVGVWRPCIVLPEGLAESIASDSLRDVLVHECAHVIRRDAWVGLLQRLAGALFWPHPLVHYASAQLTRAREEVCDNHVLRCGSPGGYARTLLDLTERYLSSGAVRPELGLLGTGWTLADRVAGLLDSRRVSMTRTTFRMKIAVWAVLTVTGLGGSSVRFDRSARAGGPQAEPTEPRAAARAALAPPIWIVEGTVVDEQGRPVAGAIVRAVVHDGVEEGSKTSADGLFALALGARYSYIRGVIAETGGGARIGLIRFDRVRWLGAKDPVRIVVKPSQPVRVRVNDAAGLPVAGAAVEAIDFAFQTHATTGPDGTANLRVSADAKVRWVIGLKAGAGFDYFENYRTTPAADYPPLPADVSLILEGAHTARVNAVDSTGQAVPGVEIGLSHLRKIGKISHANVGQSAIARATTDQQGFATFGWLPLGGEEAIHFYIATGGNFTSRDQPYYQRGGPAQLTAHLLRDTRLGGSVRFPDGRPAGGLLIRAEGGARSGRSINLATRTLADGSYVLDAPSESSYIVTVADETWAAPSLSNIIVREGRAQSGLDFVLTKGTLLHGQVSEAPGRRPAGGALVWLTEEGGPVAMDLRRSGFLAAKLMQSSTADANGRYHFRVGPGHYSLLSPHAGGTEPLTVEVKNEAEIVRDLALAGSVRATYFSGVVLEKTPEGDRPVARASVRTLRAGLNNSSSPSTADDQGRFRMLRVPGEQSLYGASPDRSLAGLLPLPAEADNVRLVMSKAPMITGRVIDSNGMPQAGRSLIFRIDSGSNEARSGRQVFGTGTDDQGRFKVSGAPVGAYVEVSVLYRMRASAISRAARAAPDAQPSPRSPSPRIVVRLQISDSEPVVIPDLIVPAEKPTK